MAFQRKVFRIEESMGAPVPGTASAGGAEGALRHHDFMTELQALRALLEPRAIPDRESMEQARAQIAEVQAYKHELELIQAAVERTKQDMGPSGADALHDALATRADRELHAIVSGTEQATMSILQAAEAIDHTASTLGAALKSGHQQGLAQDIQDRVVQILEACNFQDITGQRAAKVVATLKVIEERVARLTEIWNGIEQFKPVVFAAAGGGDREFLNGPKLAGDPGHSSQADVDTVFRCA
jgi:chemotaxis protein CheZ